MNKVHIKVMRISKIMIRYKKKYTFWIKNMIIKMIVNSFKLVQRLIKFNKNKDLRY